MSEQSKSRSVALTLAAASGVLVLGVAACATDLPTAETIDAMDVATAVSAAESAGLVALAENESPVFMIDSVRVEAAVARGLAPEEIASIEVRKGATRVAAGNGTEAAGVVYIATKAQQERQGLVAAREKQALTAIEVRGRPLTEATGELQPLMVERRVREMEAAASPLLVIDGMLAPSTVTLQSLDKASIESIEVVKGAAAAQLYDHPRAAHGVIRITTRAARR